MSDLFDQSVAIRISQVYWLFWMERSAIAAGVERSCGFLPAHLQEVDASSAALIVPRLHALAETRLLADDYRVQLLSASDTHAIASEILATSEPLADSAHRILCINVARTINDLLSAITIVGFGDPRAGLRCIATAIINAERQRGVDASKLLPPQRLRRRASKAFRSSVLFACMNKDSWNLFVRFYAQQFLPSSYLTSEECDEILKIVRRRLAARYNEIWSSEG